jgi:hypothetical protein
MADEMNLRFLAVEYLVVQTNIRQARTLVVQKKRALSRALADVDDAEAEVKKLEHQNGMLYRHLLPEEKAFIEEYQEAAPQMSIETIYKIDTLA